MNKTRSLLAVAMVYSVAVAAAAAWFFAGHDSGRLWLDALIADLIATLIVFTASRVHRNSSFYDPYWSVFPPLLIAAWWTALEQPIDARIALASLVVLVWAIRLTGNWIYAWPGLHHEDWRYPLLRDRAGRAAFVVDLMAIHVIPTILVFLGTLPVYVVLQHTGRPIGWLDVVATVVGLAAVALSFVADLQLYRFARTRQPGQAMDHGLWSWSRHPNYFGEFSFWVALALFGLAAAPGAWWLPAGVVGMYLMFQFASIPMMEERSLARRPEYQAVIDRVARFVPRPPRR